MKNEENKNFWPRIIQIVLWVLIVILVIYLCNRFLPNGFVAQMLRRSRILDILKYIFPF